MKTSNHLLRRLTAALLAAVLALGLTACDSLPGSGGHIVKPPPGQVSPLRCTSLT